MRRRSVFLFLILLLLGLKLHAAGGSDPDGGVGPVRALHLVTPAESSLGEPVRVRFTLRGDELTADFDVRTPKVFARRRLAPNQYPFQADVVELFVSVAGGAAPLPYFEFELSPYDQTFEVRIDDPKKPFKSGFAMGIKHATERTADGWKARLTIPLKNLGWDGDVAHVRGNAFAILGAPPRRSFWSLSLPAQKKANFHQPEFFRGLVSVE